MSALSLDTWYALAVIGGQERSIRGDILKTLERHGAQREVKEIVFPDEEVVVDSGTPAQKTVRRGVLPGYLLIRGRRLSDGTVSRIANTRGVLGFMGGNESPTPLGPNDLTQILGKNAGKSSSAMRPRFVSGDQVQIMRGPMADFTGSVQDVNDGKQVATVIIEIFGRATPVQVAFSDLSSVR